MSAVFVDTSALIAVLDAEQPRHVEVAGAWKDLLLTATPLVTTNYVTLETNAVVQRRSGMTAVRALETDLLPPLDVEWVDQDTHAKALAAFLAADRRGLSLVDCTSFEVMRRRGIRRAFALDDDFRRQGFEVLPA